MNIRIFNPAFERVGFIEAARSVNLTRRLYRPGEFELELHPSVPYAETLTRGNLVMLGGDGARCGFIEYTALEAAPGGEVLKAGGRTLEALLAARLTVPERTGELLYEGWDRAEGPAETVMKHYVAKHCAYPEEPDRAFPGLSVAPDLGRGPWLPWQARFEPVSNVLAGIYPYARLGYRVSFKPEAKELVFDVIEGRDLTAGQAENPRCVSAVGRGSFSELLYSQDATGQANAGYAGGKGYGETRFIREIGGGSGFGRFESFISCGGAEAEELYATAEAKLAGRGVKTRLKARLARAPSSGHGLGDYVSVLHEARGVRLDAQIEEISESYGPEGRRFEYVFRE